MVDSEPVLDATSVASATVAACSANGYNVAAAVVEMIAREEKAARVRAVRTQAHRAGVMDVALINPHLAALVESQAMTAARDLHTAQAEMMHWRVLAEIEHVLLVIRTGENHLRPFLRHDPDRCLRCAADTDVPRALHTVSACGDDQLVAGLQGGDGIGECVIPRV